VLQHSHSQMLLPLPPAFSGASKAVALLKTRGPWLIDAHPLVTSCPAQCAATAIPSAERSHDPPGGVRGAGPATAQEPVLAHPGHVRAQGEGLYEGLDWLATTLKTMQAKGLATSVISAVAP